MTGNQSIVMIVDDDDSIRKAVRRLMKAYGFAVEGLHRRECARPGDDGRGRWLPCQTVRRRGSPQLYSRSLAEHRN